MSGSLTRRIETLEQQGCPNDWAHVLDRLSDADLDRLIEIITARDAGEWTGLSELPADDVRILNQIGIFEEAQ